MQMQLTQGRPDSPEGRLSKELAVYDLLDRLGIDYQRVDHDAAFTMEACLEVDTLLAPAVMCKNLLLCNTQKTRFYLLMLGCDKKFRTGEISRQIGSARLSFAPPEPMEEYLDITPGCSLTRTSLHPHWWAAIRASIPQASVFPCGICLRNSCPPSATIIRPFTHPDTIL